MLGPRLVYYVILLIKYYNSLPLVLKARHLGGSAFCNVDRLGVPI